MPLERDDMLAVQQMIETRIAEVQREDLKAIRERTERSETRLDRIDGALERLAQAQLRTETTMREMFERQEMIRREDRRILDGLREMFEKQEILRREDRRVLHGLAESLGAFNEEIAHRPRTAARP